MDWKLYFVQGIEILFLGIGAYFDIKDCELPIRFLGVSGMIGVALNVIWRYQDFADMFIGGCIGMIFLGVGWLTKEAIGYGDGIGLVILGILEGWQGMIPIVFGAFLLSSIYGIWKLIGLKESGSSTMPFFPFLLMALIGVILL